MVKLNQNIQDMILHNIYFNNKLQFNIYHVVNKGIHLLSMSARTVYHQYKHIMNLSITK
jgi:hypothetical protein